jgi:hypothetical protein
MRQAEDVPPFTYERIDIVFTFRSAGDFMLLYPILFVQDREC